jgi:hypothetical protein
MGGKQYTNQFDGVQLGYGSQECSEIRGGWGDRNIKTLRALSASLRNGILHREMGRRISNDENQPQPQRTGETQLFLGNRSGMVAPQTRENRTTYPMGSNQQHHLVNSKKHSRNVYRKAQNS